MMEARVISGYVKRFSSDADAQSQLTLVINPQDFDTASRIARLTGQLLYVTVVTEPEFKAHQKQKEATSAT